MSTPRQPVPTPAPQRMADFKQRQLPLVVWSVCALLVLVMMVSRVGRSEYIGLAQALQYEISASSTGTLDSVYVDLYQNVKPGEIVAALNDDAVLASIETANATVALLSDQLEATRVSMLADAGQGVADHVADLRRFQIDENRMRLDALALRAQITGDEVELERLALEVRKGIPLRDGGVISELDFRTRELEHEALRKNLDENRILLGQTESEYIDALDRRRAYERDLPEVAPEERLLAPLHAAIEVESRRLREIELQRSALVLRSPVAGQVTQILCRQGQSVVPGEPILTIVEQSVSEIVAYVREAESFAVGPESRVLLSSLRNGGDLAESAVTRISPGFELIPQRLWRDPRFPDHGRAVVIATPGMGLTPGELVRVRFLDD